MVALLGSRQVGKTTLAKQLQLGKHCHYLDLERPSDLAKLSDPELYLSGFENQLVILDEIQRIPELFPVLRSLVDERRQKGERCCHFLILGSASPELLQQSSETLAGRISYLELTPLNLLELPQQDDASATHWFRGGYPDSYLSVDDATAMQWCDDFILSYTERYLPQMGINSTPIQLRRLCSMLAHQQGATLNISQLANSLGISAKTIRHYLDLLEGLFLIRRLPAWSRNAGKRLVKAPKLYLRDTGLLHSLAGLSDLESLLGHPLCGHSWEGYCIEQILQKLPKGTGASHYRTQAGAEIDLMLEARDGSRTAIEIKRTLSPKLTRAFRESIETVKADRGFYIIPEGERYPMADNVEAISLSDYLELL
ncbi:MULTISPECIES: ATP-binding protein [unclassified Lentimonas]|uniref:ATP-binding protein n=1 Tax=unclassified Lentimonas TaxID=2630993 RepID=UPI001FD2932D|nr:MULTISPECIES: ATP-binding protein [unclassified Lentimonas]